jgi:hypothetical protein
MKTLATILLPAVCCAAAPALEIEAVLDLARSAPPEVAADTFIRVAGLNQIEKKSAVDLLERAFEMASGAPQPFKRVPVLPRAIGPSGFLARAYRQDLDANSLRLRAVAGLLPLDARRARERFQEIPPLALAPLTCDDFMVYDLDRFYEVLGQVAAQGFTPKEIREEEPSKFLAGYIGRIASAVEVAPAARMLASVSLSDSQFQSLATGLAGALGHIADDDRAFTYGAQSAGGAILALVELGQRRQVSPLILLGAYRAFLVNHLSSARCEDREPADPAAFFNDKLSMPPLLPIDISEITPSKVEGKAKGLAWCENPECRAIREQYRLLVTKETGEVVQSQDREQSQWQARVRDLLTAIAAWTASTDATPAEHFREKIGFFGDVLAIVPSGPTREFVLRSLVDFLSQSRPQAENRLEWLLAVNQLVGRVHLDPLGLGRMAGDLRAARDPVIALAMALEAIAPRPANEVMLLM